MARIVWSPRASRDYQSYLTIIGQEAGSTVQTKWRRKIDKAVKALERFPEMGSPVDEFGIDGIREQIVKPYRIIYRFTGSVCHIARVIRVEQDLEQVVLF